jgi:phenylalanyl-tRNA synthetase beta chain
MKFSTSWLKEFTEVKDVAALASLFSLHSQEVEDVRPLLQQIPLVVGHVKDKQAHPEADKLSVCQVDVGPETLQIVCGAPNVAKGQKVIVATVGTKLPDLLIQEATIRGVKSQGMICSLPEIGLEPPFGDASGIEVLPGDATVGSHPFASLSFDDTVIELGLTPNRGDLLSMMGIAYDVSAIFDQPLTLPTVHVNESTTPNPVVVQIETPGCMSYAARVLEGIQIQPSPAWLKARLIAAGIRPINNVVDVTNYIMLETGQPLHAFDLDKFGSHKVLVRQAKEGETTLSLDEIERTLTSSDVVITNGTTVTAIGGIKGGLETGIDATTKRVLLESATFSPLHIRKTAQRLDLRSEASSRFEKGVDPKRTLLALERATMLLQELAGAVVHQGVAKAGRFDATPVTISMSLAAIQQSFGMDIDSTMVESLLRRLQFGYQLTNHVFDVSIPSRRGDVKTTQDLVEELARLYGPNQIPSTLPVFTTQGGLRPLQKVRRSMRRLMSSLGFHEAVTYSLVAEEVVDLGWSHLDALVKVQSPMSETKVVLRQSVLPSLLDVVKYHHARQMNDVQLFEVSHIHNQAYEEVIAGAISGQGYGAVWKNKTGVDFYDASGVVQQLFDLLGVRVALERRDVPALYHPGQSAACVVGGTVVGYVGNVHPKWQKAYDIKETFVFELRWSALVAPTLTRIKPVPKFPAVTRELTFVVGNDVLAGDVIQAVNDAATTYLKEVRVYDLYQTTETAMTLSCVFQDETKTLSSDAVQADVDAIVAALATKHYRFKDVK